MSRINKMFLESFQINEEEGDDIFRDRTQSDRQAYEGGMDRDTNPEDFETDDIGFDANSQQEEEFVKAFSKVDMLERTIEELISPDDGQGSLLKILAQLDRNDSIAKGVADRVRRDAKKASDSLSAIANELKTVASMEPSLRRKLESLQGQ